MERDIVNTILNNSQLRASLERTVRTAITNQSPVNSEVSASHHEEIAPRNLGIPQQQTIRGELERLFPSCTGNSGNRRGRATSRRRQNTTYLVKEVVVLNSPNTIATPRGLSKASLYESGRALSNVKLDSNWSENTVNGNFRRLFPFLEQFELVTSVGGRLTKIRMEEGCSCDGATIKRVFHQKTIYLRPTTDEISDENLPGQTSPSTESGMNYEAFIEEACTSGQQNPAAASAEYASRTADADDDLVFEEDLSQAIQNSLNDNDTNDSSPDAAVLPSASSAQEMLKKVYLENRIDGISLINVFRGDIWNCCARVLKRPSFSPLKEPSVMFTDIHNTSEGAIDSGGPRREFFRLVLEYIKDNLFEGEEDSKQLVYRNDYLQEKRYHSAGILTAMSMFHGGPAPTFFSEKFYNFFCGHDINLDILNADILIALQNLKEANDVTTLNEVLDNPHLILAGCPTFVVDFSRKELILEGTIRFYANLRYKGIVEQFIDGFRMLKMYEVVRENQNGFRNLFCNEELPLTATDLNRIFSIELSEEGSSKRLLESKALCYFRDFIIECEEKTVDMSTAEILIFSTGLEREPPLGFPQQPSIKFIHDDNQIFPKANTCELSLHLPTVHKNYEDFSRFLLYGFKEGMVFGFE